MSFSNQNGPLLSKLAYLDYPYSSNSSEINTYVNCSSKKDGHSKDFLPDRNAKNLDHFALSSSNVNAIYDSNGKNGVSDASPAHKKDKIAFESNERLEDSSPITSNVSGSHRMVHCRECLGSKNPGVNENDIESAGDSEDGPFDDQYVYSLCLDSNLHLSAYKASRLIKHRSISQPIVDLLDLYPKLEAGGKKKGMKVSNGSCLSFVVTDSEIDRKNEDYLAKLTKRKCSISPLSEAAKTVCFGKSLGIIFHGDEAFG